MIESIPFFIPILFFLTTIATLCLFYWIVKNATTENTRRKAVPILFILIGWLILQGGLALIHVYNATINSMPPKIMVFGILPPLLTILLLFLTTAGRAFIDSLPLRNITWLNIVRLPVELGLLMLFLHKAVPLGMTMEGRNFDIISGISAPFIAWFGFTKRLLSKNIILAWNIICLCLLLNVVVTALLSVPSPLQKLAFDQPNIAILYFPFNWLPVFIVPIVLLGHLVSIRQLLAEKNKLPTDGD